MIADPAVIKQLVTWGESHPEIRAMVLFSSRVDSDAKIDPFSDYDILCVVNDVHIFHTDSQWLTELGEVLVVFRNPIGREFDFESFAFFTHFKNGPKVDFCFFPVAFLQWIRNQGRLPDWLDRGYTVLLDKDHLAHGIPTPTRSAYQPRPPTAEEYRSVIEEFFNDAAYVAKNLWRDNLFGAKLSLDHIMKYQCLRRMLEWHAQLHHGWKADLGPHGKGLKLCTESELWHRLEATYVGAGQKENWEALFLTVALFRDVAIEVAQGTGLEYLQDLDQRMAEHLRSVRRSSQTSKGMQ